SFAVRVEIHTARTFKYDDRLGRDAAELAVGVAGECVPDIRLRRHHQGSMLDEWLADRLCRHQYEVGRFTRSEYNFGLQSSLDSCRRADFQGALLVLAANCEITGDRVDPGLTSFGQLVGKATALVQTAVKHRHLFGRALSADHAAAAAKKHAYAMSCPLQ